MNQTVSLTLAACALAAMFSGCVANEAAAPPTVPDLGGTAETGSIHGILVDEGLLPISGGTVTLDAEQRSVHTTTEGVFAILNVPVGEQILTITAPGYETVQIKVSVEAEQTSHVDVKVKRIATTDAYYEIKVGKGMFGCGATYRQGVTTVNGAFFGIAGCATGAEYTGLDDFLWDAYLTDKIDVWLGAAFETEWVSNQALGNGMVQDWAVFGCANNRNATFTRDAGPSPLRETINAFQLHYRLNDLENSSCDGHERCNMDECHIQNRMFSWPSTQDAQARVDVGLTLQQTFTTYLTEFYRAEPPPAFTALPDA